jgi:hypothetical protein
VFRRVLPFDHVLLRAALCALIGIALVLVTTSAAGATDAVGTPTASEYTRETTPAAERRPEASTSADLRLATGLSVAAVIVMVTVVLSDRGATASDREEAMLAPTRPVVVRPIRPTEVLPEAA